MGFFVNYGMVEYGFPYKPQDNYTRNLIDTEQDCVVLENEHLKATFFPQFGGKLHSLFDKKEKRNLLFSNSIVRPCHLGVRNAWMSGGVEWNCGYVGHNAFTGDRWKNFLTADEESGSYNEIQAGLAKIQYECLPMPPKTVWEWVEAYGAIQTDPEKVHGSWDEARKESALRLGELITEEAMESLLQATKKMAKTPAKKTLFRADGWGALEEARRRFSGEDALCFCSVGKQ